MPRQGKVLFETFIFGWLFALEWKLADLWIGSYARPGEIWICLIPCLPIHIRWRKSKEEAKNIFSGKELHASPTGEWRIPYLYPEIIDYARPSYRLRHALWFSIDGNMYQCSNVKAMDYYPDDNTIICGYGDSPNAAMRAFDREFETALLRGAKPRGLP